MGTCDYMAPEQALDTPRGRPSGRHLLLGCTLYRLLTGKLLYKGETVMRILLAHRTAADPFALRRPSRRAAAVGRRVPENGRQEAGRPLPVDGRGDCRLEACLSKRSSVTRVGGDQPTETLDRPMHDELAFLQQSRKTATAAKKEVESPAEVTIAHQAAVDTSGQFSPSQRLLLASRKKKTILTTFIGFGVLG